MMKMLAIFFMCVILFNCEHIYEEDYIKDYEIKKSSEYIEISISCRNEYYDQKMKFDKIESVITDGDGSVIIIVHGKKHTFDFIETRKRDKFYREIDWQPMEVDKKPK